MIWWCGFCKVICVSGFLFWFCLFNIPSFSREIKRAGGELRARARAPCGRMVLDCFSLPQARLGMRSPNSRANRFSAAHQL
jgi:hypothetical protein